MQARNSGTASAEATAVGRQSLNISQQTLYDECDDEIEEVSLRLNSPQRFPRSAGSSELQDMVPQLPIRKESSSMQSVSLYDLDPEDSLPRFTTQQQPNHPDQLNMPIRKRTQHRLPEYSSSGSSTLGPPTSVFVPTESQWSGISTLVTCDEEREIERSRHGEIVDYGIPPRLKNENEPSQMKSISKEMLVKLPWDKIAIGVVMLPENDSKDTPPTTRRRFPSEDKSIEDSVSFPSFHLSSESHSDANTVEYAGNQRFDKGNAPQRFMTNNKQKSPPCGSRTQSHSESRLQSHPPPLHASLRNSTGSVSHRSLDHTGVRYPGRPHNQCFSADDAKAERDVLPWPKDQVAIRSSPVANNGGSKPLPRPTVSSNTSTNLPVEEVMIFVSPDVQLPLRGAHETWKAIEEGRATVTSCLSCNIELHCLENAQLVACPDCTMLSPVDQSDESPDNKDRHGVGVGVKPAAIIQWMKDLK